MLRVWKSFILIYKHTFVFIYVWMCMYVGVCACLAAHTRVICSHEFSNSIWFYFFLFFSQCGWCLMSFYLEKMLLLFLLSWRILDNFPTHTHTNTCRIMLMLLLLYAKNEDDDDCIWMLFICVYECMYVHLWLPMRVYVTCAYRQKKINNIHEFFPTKTVKIERGKCFIIWFVEYCFFFFLGGGSMGFRDSIESLM